MQDTSERLNKRQLDCGDFRGRQQAVQGRHGDVLGHRSRRAGDARFLEVDALVGISGSTVGAERKSPGTVAIQSLVARNKIARPEILYARAYLKNLSAEFVAEDLGLYLERNRAPFRVQPIIIVTLEQMKICSAHTDCSDPQDDNPRFRFRVADVPHTHSSDIFKYSSFHSFTPLQTLN